MWIGRGGGSSAMAITLGNVSGGNKASEIIDRWIEVRHALK